MIAAEWIVRILSAYAAIGFLFGIAFVSAGVGRVDPAAKGSGIAFRLVILPGAAAVWPLALALWVRNRGRAS